MTRDDLLSAAAIAIPTGTGFLRGYCPYCEEEAGGVTPSKRNLSINVVTGRFNCWRCEEYGYIRGLDEVIFIEHEDYDDAPDEDEPEDVEFQLPREFVSLSSRDSRDSISMRAAYRFLKSRNVPRKAIPGARLGATTHGFYQYSVVVPIYDHGRCRGYVARRVLEKTYLYPKGMKRGEVMFNMDALSVRTDEPCIIVEGCFDALPHWPHAVAVLGKPSRIHEEMLRAAKRPLAICLDADAQRQGWALATSLSMHGVRAEYLQLRPGTDPGDTPREWMMREIERLFRKRSGR